jgi:hypothetical protein
LREIKALARALALVGVMCGLRADGAYLRYESEINSNADIIVFYNSPSSAANIEWITVTLGTNVAFSTTPAPVQTSPSNPITIAHFSVPWTAQNTAAQVGFTGNLTTYGIVNGAQSVTFAFNDFNPGEGWGLSVNMVKVSGTGSPGGADFNGLFVQVKYAGYSTILTSSCTDPNYSVVDDECLPATFGGNKRSFPSANSADAFPDVPEPSTWLSGAGGLLVLAILRRRK